MHRVRNENALNKMIRERDESRLMNRINFERSKNLFETGFVEDDQERESRLNYESESRMEGREWLLHFVREWNEMCFQGWTLFEVELLKLLMVEKPELFEEREAKTE